MVRARKRAKLKQYKTLLNLLVLAFLVGCKQQTVVPISSPTDVGFVTQAPTITSTFEVSDNPTSNVFTIHSFCPEINHDSNALTNLTGTIVLGGDKISLGGQDFTSEQDENSILLFWNTSSRRGTIYPLPGQQFNYYLSSPDRTKLALTEGKTLPMRSEVLVLTAQAQKEASFTLPDDWTLFDWLNNNRLLTRQIRLRGENLGLVAIDPTTGEQEFLPSDFPNLYSNETLYFWGALTIFNPTASLVVYPERKGNELISVFWDVQNNKEITSITGLSKWPGWTPDGSRLLIVVDHRSTPTDSGHEEIHFFKPDGEVFRSTFFEEHFEHNIINLPMWSPNDRYVAFWLSTSVPIKTARLAVLDTETSTVDLYCKEFDPFPYRMAEQNTLGYSYYQINAASPVWSPESKYLLIEDYQEFRSSTYLFGLENHSITKIADSARPVSWLK
jgi:hypothetical protein